MYTKEMIVRLYKKMLLIRRFECRLAEIYHTDVVKSPIHLSVGQESVAVGICDALKVDDVVSNTYRCHATYIAKGGDLNVMMAELFGKKTGCAGGKAGSMHLIDIKNGILGASAVVGSTIPVATGFALALQMEAKQKPYQRVVACVFGDGGTEEGCFYESINFAALHRLPIIFICENNRLAIHSPLEKRWATNKLCERIATFGMEVYKIDNGDVFVIRDTMARAVHAIRNKGGGPIFIECATYRWLEHVGPRDDHSDAYRDPEEYKCWQAADQILRLANLLDEQIKKQVDDDITQMIQTAEDFAIQSSFPPVEDLYKHVYAS